MTGLGGYQGLDLGGGRRSRKGKWIALATAVVVVIAAGGTTAVVLKQRHDDAVRKSLQEATSVVDGYLAAWSRGDAAKAASYATADSSAAVRSTLAATRTQLGVVSSTYAPSGPVSTGHAAGSAYTASVKLQDFGAWKYTGRIGLLKIAGHWQVAFTPDAVYPGFVAGDAFVRTRTPATRGSILLAGGQSMYSADPDLSANVRGSVTPVSTAAQAKKLGPTVHVGDDVGTSGLERVYDKELAGTAGGTLGLKHATGKVDILRTIAPVNGKDVTTTLNLQDQQAGEQAVSSVGFSGGLVAVDTTTGQVLAMVDHPATGTARAFNVGNPPGSTFKMITTTAALLAGIPSTLVQSCPSVVSEDGRKLHNSEHESFGNIDFAEAFAVSCNTWFVQLAARVPFATLEKAAALYGFSTTTAAAAGGFLPIQSVGGYYPKPRDLAAVAGESIGQDGVIASPLAMAEVAAAISGGTWHQPTLRSTDTGASNVLPGNIAATIKGFMAGVLTGNGTAAGVSFPAGTYGKTGTAETGVGDLDAGFNGNVAFAVEFDNAGFGAAVAAPAAARFLRAIGRK